MDFAAGIRVSARGLAWNVIDVEHLGGQQLLRLRCDEGDLRGLEWEILHPNERVEIIRAGFRPEAAGPLTAWRLHHTACLLEQVLGPRVMLAAEPGRVQVEPYQLVPLMRALELPRPRLLLADGVGLGKTIQASLIATELIARRRAHRVLVVSPAGPLLVQWEQELRQRFGLRFTPITDSATLQQERRKIELGGNPFDAMALCLISLDFAKQERVLEDLERASWDLAIIDEAHHCISAGTTADREDTLRRHLAEVVAKRSDGLLLLTATPHDGYDPHFASLIELLDPSLVDGRGGLMGLAYRRHVVRRLKSHIRDPATGAPMFRTRRVIPVRVEVTGADTEPVRAFHQTLAALVAPRLQRAARSNQYGDALAFVGLLKRSVSTIAACVKTLRVVAERYAQLGSDEAEAAALHKERARALRTYRRRALQFGVLDAAAEADVARLEADDMAADLHSHGAADLAVRLATRAPLRHRPTNETVAALDELIRMGAAAEPRDPKLDAVAREIRLIRGTDPAANILIYTEYADSQLAALRMLRDVAGIRGEVLTISGLDPERERTRAVELCSEQDCIILISTDSLAEGINLQQRCCHLIHLDLPYNPNRLEQRNGRIDRYGQRRDPQIRYLYLAATFEERLLLRLIAKYEKARECLAVMPETLGVTADEDAFGRGLMAGFAEEQAGLFAEEAPAVRTLDQVGEETNADAYRDLVHEIDRAFEGYERIAARHGWMADRGLNADAAQMAAAEAGRLRGDASVGHVDLLHFVADAIHAETSTTTATGNLLHLPADWAVGVHDLPGFEPATNNIRLTRQRNLSRDSQGRPLGFLGRAHPLVRRAIARVRRSEIIDGSDRLDIRVSAARADVGAPVSLLCSFSVDLHSTRHVALQRVTAVLLPKGGLPVELPNPKQWLAMAARNRAIPTAGLWRQLYQDWVPQRDPEVTALATVTMQRLAADFVAAQHQCADREVADLDRWLRGRASDICGQALAQSVDLFDPLPSGPPWQTLSAPIDRLASFAVDANNTPARRREADSAVELFRRSGKERAERALLSPPILRPVGLLMLVPPEFGA